MEGLLARVTQQAMNYAIRSGIAITSGYAIQQCSRLVQTTGRSAERDELATLQARLDSKIRIMGPAIDMIELIAARGNTTLESAVSLTKDLRWEMQVLGQSVAKAAAEEERASKTTHQLDLELNQIIRDVKRILGRLEDAVPLINLAITTSGVSLSTRMPPCVSPSRLLQASTFLSAGDARYSANRFIPSQVGPDFYLSMYMLFLGHASHAQEEDSLRSTIWKEVIHKARLRIMRVPLGKLGQPPASALPSLDTESVPTDPLAYDAAAESRSDEFAYHLTIVEDLADDRVHTFEADDPQPEPVDGVSRAGIRTSLPVHQISKIFYADTGKVLNIGGEGEANNPVLLLKRDPHAFPPRRLMQRSELLWDLAGSSPSRGSPLSTTTFEETHSKSKHTSDREAPVESLGQSKNPWALPANLDPEWMAFEIYSENSGLDTDSDSEHLDGSSSPVPSDSGRPESVDSSFVTALSQLAVETSDASTTQTKLSANRPYGQIHSGIPFASMPPITTTLSLLEMLIRLTSLQQFQQSSHLAVSDELLNFFLDESSTTGAAPGDVEARKRIRSETRQHVGFDPYDESPVKRRGEAYQAQQHEYDDDAGWNGSHDFARSPSYPQSDQSLQQSPLLLRSHAHSSRSRSNTPIIPSVEHNSPGLEETPPLPVQRTATGRSATRRGASQPQDRAGTGRVTRAAASRGSKSSPLTQHIPAPVDGDEGGDED